MSTEQPLRYAIASCWDESFKDSVPWVPLGPFDAERLGRQVAPAQSIALVPLFPGSRSLYLHADALWMVLDLTDGIYDPASDEMRFASAMVVYRGRPQEVCAWLLKNGLPTPADDVEVSVGVNTQHVTADHGFVIGARFGTAETGFMGIASIFMGDAIAGDRGVAITCNGKAIGGNGAAAIATGWGDAHAGDSGVAATLDEFGKASAGAGGVAVAGYGGWATAGPNGVAISDGGTVSGARGAILIVRSREQVVIARVGEHGIRPDAPYHVRNGRLVEGEWDATAR